MCGVNEGHGKLKLLCEPFCLLGWCARLAREMSEPGWAQELLQGCRWRRRCQPGMSEGTRQSSSGEARHHTLLEFLFISVCVCVRVRARTYAHASMPWHPVKGQYVGTDSLLQPCGTWGLYLGCQARWHLPLAAEPSHRPWV